jgi:uncharacterized protein
MRKPSMSAFFLVLMILLLCTYPASAKTYHITLLTIGEAGERSVGGVADAYLEVAHGSGRIFLDSFPLTKLDTQISTRYANEVACDYLDMDCSDYDFFYTIRAGSTIVGGPSASGSLTVLTIAALKELKISNDTVMTGTINSGGSIGPVGGVVKKAIAAEKAGFKRVLVPLFFINSNEIINMSINLTNQSIINISEIVANESKNISKDIGVYDDNLSLEDANLAIEVIKVGNIDDALYYFTGYRQADANGNIVVPNDYSTTMKSIAENLCKRSLELKSNISLDEEDANKSKAFIDNINKSFLAEEYYSSASYCFNLGVMLRKASLKEVEKNSPLQLEELATSTRKAVNDFDKRLESINLTTISQLESYIIVKERLLQSEESLGLIEKNMSSDELAYAVERYYSAVYWSEFFNVKGEPVELDKEYLKEACYKKLSEAEERINYAALYIPWALDDAQASIDQAYGFSSGENYEMCLFKASFAKAESNLLLSTISVSKEQVEQLADEKLKAAKKLIAKEQSRGFFPIMGYSYYEYANSLRQNNEPVVSLIFSEYALELGNIEIYFPKKEFEFPYVNYDLVAFGLSFFLFGVVVGLALSRKGVIRKEPRNPRR